MTQNELRTVLADVLDHLDRNVRLVSVSQQQIDSTTSLIDSIPSVLSELKDAVSISTLSENRVDLQSVLPNFINQKARGERESDAWYNTLLSLQPLCTHKSFEKVGEDEEYLYYKCNYCRWEWREEKPEPPTNP